MAERPNLDEDKGGKLIDPTRFRGMVGSLMYLSASRPDIVFAVCMCARYQAKPTEMHLTAIKRIFRYLKGTIHMGLWYPKDSGFELKAFADADYIKEQVERKVVELYFVETKYQLADIFTKVLPRERFATLLPLKELQDESISESKGRTVADSIAERLTRPTAYKFKTDCSIIPVWFSTVLDKYSFDVLNTHSAWVKASKEIAGLMLMTMEPDIQKNLKQLGAYDMLKELKTLQFGTSRSCHDSKLSRFSLILVSLRKEYDSFVKNYNMHCMGKTMTELHAMLKLHEQTLPPKDAAPALHAIRAGRV
ncbi:hypothetical protein Tco_1570617 [Tanacetum coccineum]